MSQMNLPFKWPFGDLMRLLIELLLITVLESIRNLLGSCGLIVIARINTLLFVKQNLYKNEIKAVINKV